MNKEQWKSLFDTLDKLHSDFYLAYNDSQNVKNKKIKTEANENVDRIISRASHHISKNREAFELLTEKDPSIFGKNDIFQEFKSPGYFYLDLKEFLEKLKVKINSF